MAGKYTPDSISVTSPQLLERSDGYNELGQLVGYVEYGTETHINTEAQKIVTVWQAHFADAIDSHGVAKHNLTTNIRSNLAGDDVQKVAREWSNAQYRALDGRLASYLEKITTTRTTTDGSTTSIAATHRQSTDYYEATDTLHNVRKGMLKGYRELQIGTAAYEKPTQVIVDNISYMGRGFQKDSQTVTADEDLTGAILRRLADWLGAPLTVAGTVDLITLLFPFAASVGAESPASLVNAWLSANLTGADASGVDILKGIVTRLAEMAINPVEAINASALVLINDVQTAWATLAATVTFFKLKVQTVFAEAINNATEKDKLPAVFVNSNAYQALRPFDYSLNVTRKTVTEWDNGRPTKWIEKTRSSAALDKTIESQVEVTYEGDTQRQKTYSARIHETVGDEADKSLDKVSHVFRTDYVYHNQDPVSYKDVSFEGVGELTEGNPDPRDYLTINGIRVRWTELDAAKKNEAIHAFVSNASKVKEIVFIQDYSGIQYDANGRMIEYDSTTYKKGLIEGDWSELAGALESFSTLENLIARQNAIVSEATGDYTTATQDWIAARNNAAAYFKLNLSENENKDIVVQKASEAMSLLLATEAQKEKAYNEELNTLTNARTVLSKAEAKLIEAQLTLLGAQDAWKSWVDSFGRFKDEWRSGSNVDELIINAKTNLNTLGQAFSPTANDSLLKPEKEKFLDLKEDIEEWQTKFLRDRSGFDTTGKWDDALASLNGLKSEWDVIQADIATKINNILLKYSTDLIAETQRLAGFSDTGAAFTKLQSGWKDIDGSITTFQGDLNLWSGQNALANGVLGAGDIYGDSELPLTVARAGEIGGWSPDQTILNLSQYLVDTKSDLDSMIEKITLAQQDIQKAISNSNGYEETKIKKWNLLSAAEAALKTSLKTLQDEKMKSFNESFKIYFNKVSELVGHQKELILTKADISVVLAELKVEDDKLVFYRNLPATRWFGPGVFIAKNRQNSGHRNKLHDPGDGWKRWLRIVGDVVYYLEDAGSWREVRIDQIHQTAKNILNLNGKYNQTHRSYLSGAKIIEDALKRKNEIREGKNSTNKPLDSLYKIRDELIIKTNGFTNEIFINLLTDVSNKAKAIKDAFPNISSLETDRDLALSRYTRASNNLQTALNLQICLSTLYSGQIIEQDAFFNIVGYASSRNRFASGYHKAKDEFLNAISLIRRLASGLNETPVSWKVAFEAKENADTEFASARQLYNKARSSRLNGDDSIARLQTSSANHSQLGLDLNLQNEELSRMNVDRDKAFARLVQLLESNHSIQIDETDVRFKPDQISDLAQGENITIRGEAWNLSKLTTDSRVKAITEINEINTVARRDVAFNSRGLVAGYKEISFSGSVLNVQSEGAPDAAKEWRELSAEDKKDLFQGQSSSRVAWAEYGQPVIFHNATMNAYDLLGRVNNQNIDMLSTRKGQDGDIQTHAQTVATDKMKYNKQGSLIDYEKTVTENDDEVTGEKGKVTTETVSGEMLYDIKGRLKVSDLTIAEKVIDKNGGSIFVLDRSTRIKTFVDLYSTAGQAVKQTRLILEGTKSILEKTLASNKYDDNNRIAYQKTSTRELHLDRDAQLLLFSKYSGDLDIAFRNSPIDRVTETWGYQYNAQGQAESFTRFNKEISTEGIKYSTDNVTQRFNKTSGRLNSSSSDIVEAVLVGESGVYYRRFSVQTDIDESAYQNGQVTAQTRTTLEGTKTIVEVMTELAYTQEGHLKESLNRLTESYGEIADRTIEVKIVVDKFDGAGRVLRQTKTTTDGKRVTVESNKNIADLEYDAFGRLTQQHMKVTERATTTHLDREDKPVPDYLKEYFLTQTLGDFDAAGQAHSVLRETRQSDDFYSKVHRVVENSHYDYNVLGQIKESVTVRTDQQLSSGAAEDRKSPALSDIATTKTTTSVTRVPSAGYDQSGRMVRFNSVTFEGDSVLLGSQSTPTAYKWNQLTHDQKNKLLNGQLRSELQSAIVSVNMFDVQYVGDKMSTWTASTRALGAVETTLSTLYRDVFAGLEVSSDNVPVMDDVLRGATLLYPDGAFLTSYQDLTSEEKLQLLTFSRLPTVTPAPDFLEKPFNGLRIRVPIDNTTISMRLSTTYDPDLGFVTDYQELALEGTGVILNGSYRADLNSNSLRTNLKNGLEQLPSGAGTISKETAKKLPNNFVTWTKMNDIGYNQKGESISWKTTKKEIQIKLTDLKNAADGQVYVAVNRDTTTERFETIKNAAGDEIATVEEQTMADDSRIPIYTFFQYDGEARADKLIRLTKERTSGEDIWVAEKTAVKNFKKVGTQWLYGQIRTDRALDVDKKLDYARPGDMADFMKTRLNSGLDAISTSIFITNSNTQTTSDLTTFDYDETRHPPRIARTTTARQDVLGRHSVEKTEFFYGQEGPKASHTRTWKVANPDLNSETLVWTPQNTDKITREDATIHYGSIGTLSRSDTVKINPLGGQAVEQTDFLFDAYGRVTQSDRASYSNFLDDRMFVKTDNGSILNDRGNTFLPTDFLFYNSGGQMTKELSLLEYDGRRIKSQKSITVTPLDNVTVQFNNMNEYDFADRVTKQASVQVEGVSLSDVGQKFGEFLQKFDFGNSINEAPPGSDFPNRSYTYYVRDGYVFYDLNSGNDAGLSKSYKETFVSTGSSGRSIEKWVSDIHYDSEGRLINSKTIENEKLLDGTLLNSKTVVLHVPEVGYDKFGRLHSFSRSTTDRDLVTVENIRHTFSSADGRVISSSLNVVQKSESDPSSFTKSYFENIYYQSFDPVSGKVQNQKKELIETEKLTTEYSHTIYGTAGKASSVSVSKRESGWDISNKKADYTLLDRSVNFLTSEIAYDPDTGRMIDYTRTTEEGGKRILEMITNSQYDNYGQTISYKIDGQEIDSDGGLLLNRKYSQSVTNSYNNLGQITQSFKTTIEKKSNGEHSAKTTQENTDFVYRRDGLLLSQDTTIIESGVLGALSLKKTLNLKTEFASYNSLGAANSWIKTMSDSNALDKELVEEVTSALYNKSGQLSSQTATTTERSVGLTSSLHHQMKVTTNIQYDNLNRARAITKSTVDGNRMTEEISRSLTYDLQGGLSASTYEIRERNVAYTPQNSNSQIGVGEELDHSKIVTTITTLDELGLIVQTDRLTEEKYKLANENYSVSRFYREITDSFKYNASGQMTAYKIAFSETGGQTIYTDFSQVTYNSLGQTTSIEKLTHLTGSQKMIWELLKVAYDINGRTSVSMTLLEDRLYASTTPLPADVPTQTFRKAMTIENSFVFNELGQLLGSSKDTIEFDNLSTLSTINLSANYLAKPENKESYLRKTEQRSFPPTSSTVIPLTYDKEGRLKSNSLYYREQAKNPTDGLGEIDRTYGVTMSDILYDETRGSMTGYTRVTSEGDKVTAEIISGITNDGFGRPLSQRTRFIETGSIRGTTLDHVYETSIQTSYGTDDRATSIKQIVYEGTPLGNYAFSADSVIETLTNNVAYDSRGQLKSYVRTTIEGDKETKETTLADNLFDPLGRLKSSKVQVEEKSLADNGATLNKTQTLETKNSAYDKSNRVLSYFRKSWDGHRLVSESTKSNNEYNTLGLTSQTEMTVNERGWLSPPADAFVETLPAPNMERNYSFKTNELKYDSNGRQKDFVRTTVEDLDPTVVGVRTLIESVSNQIYEGGKLVGSQNYSEEKIGSEVEKAYLVNLLDARYNALGQLVGQIRERQDVYGFDNNKKPIFSKKNREEISLLRYDIEGNNSESISRNIEMTVDFRPELDNMKLFNATDIVYSVIASDSLGRPTETLTTLSGATSAPDKVSTINRTEIRYSLGGQLQSYIDRETNNAAPERENFTERISTANNDLGLPKAWSEKTWFNELGMDRFKTLTLNKNGLEKFKTLDGTSLVNNSIDNLLSMLQTSTYTQAEKEILLATTVRGFVSEIIRSSMKENDPSILDPKVAKATDALMSEFLSLKVESGPNQALLESLTLADLIELALLPSFEEAQISYPLADASFWTNVDPPANDKISTASADKTLHQALYPFLRNSYKSHLELKKKASLSVDEELSLDLLIASLLTRGLEKEEFAQATVEVTDGTWRPYTIREIQEIASLTLDLDDERELIDQKKNAEKLLDTSFRSYLKSVFYSTSDEETVDRTLATLPLWEAIEHLDDEGQFLSTQTLGSILKKVLVKAFQFKLSEVVQRSLIDEEKASTETLAEEIVSKLVIHNPAYGFSLQYIQSVADGDITINGPPILADNSFVSNQEAAEYLLAQSFQGIIQGDVFNPKETEGLSQIFEEVLGGGLDSVSLVGRGQFASGSLGALIYKFAGVTDGGNSDLTALAQGLTTKLNDIYLNFTDRVTVKTSVTSVQYSLGRIESKTETKSWKSVGGGAIPGLDPKWKNGTNVSVETGFKYYTNTDRLAGQIVSATAEAPYADHPDGWINNASLTHRFVDGDYVYDYAGRQTRNTSLVVAPVEWDYQSYNGKLRDKYRTASDIHTTNMATVTKTVQYKFDEYGRARSIDTEWQQSNANRVNGATHDEVISYSPDGLKKQSKTNSKTIIELHHDRNSRDHNLHSPLGTAVASDWSILKTDFKGALDSLYGVDIYNKAGDEGVGDRYFESNKSGTVQHKYDAYGNPDDKATEEASKDMLTTVSQLVGAGDGLTKTGKILDVGITVLRVIVRYIALQLLFSPFFWIALILIAIDILLAGLQENLRTGDAGKSWRAAGREASNRFKEGLKEIAVDFVISFIPGLKDLKDFIGEVVRTAVKIAVYVAIDVTVAYTLGTRDNSELWKTAGVSALTAAASIVKDFGLTYSLKILVVTALNYQAAKEQGLRGSQLLTAGALSLASAIVSNLGVDPNSGKEAGNTFFSGIFGGLIGALVAEIVARIIVNNIDNASGQALAMGAVQIISNLSSNHLGGIVAVRDNGGGSKYHKLFLKLTNNKGSSDSGFQLGFNETFRSSLSRLVEEKASRNILEKSRSSGPESDQAMANLINATRLNQVYLGILLEKTSAVATLVSTAITSPSRLLALGSEIWAEIKGLSPTLFGGLGFEVKATVNSIDAQVETVRESGRMDRLSLDSQPKEKSIGGNTLGLLGNSDRENEYVLVTNKTIDAGKLESVIDSALEAVDLKKISVADAGKAIGPDAVKNFQNTLAKQGIKYDSLVGAVDNKTGVVFLFAIDAKKGVVAYTNQGISGEQEITTTSFMVKNGKVTQMTGKVFRGDQVINYKQIFGAEQARAAMADIQKAEFVKGSEADSAFSNVMAQATQMREETLEDGTLLTRTYLAVGTNGELRVSASENAVFDDGNLTGYVLRVYDENGAGMVFARNTKERYANKTGTFDTAALKVAEAISALKSSANPQAAGLANLINALSGTGSIQGNILLYQEKDMAGNRVKDVVMDNDNGTLKAVVDYKNGGVVVTVMKAGDLDAVKKSFEGQGNVTFKSFDKLKGKEQTEFLSSLPSLGHRNAALLADKARAMQEALVAAMAVKKLGEAFGLETNDIFLPLPAGMATQLGLAEGTVLQATRMRMDNSGEVILEGTLVGKNLESEKNFILVGSASDMAASLGQGNDTKGAQLLLIQEKEGFRAVTYVPDGNEKGNIRLLSEGTGLSPATVRAALNKSELVGGLGAKPGILERAAESAIEGTKNAIKAIPGAETIMKMGTNGKDEKATPTENPDLPKVPESLFEQLAPMFTPGAPSLPGMGPLKVQTNLVETLFANASEILGKWDFTFMSATDDEPTTDSAPIVVASAKSTPNASITTPEAAQRVESTPIVPMETVQSSKIIEEQGTLSSFWNKVKSTTGDLYESAKDFAGEYVNDVKIVGTYMEEKATEIAQGAAVTVDFVTEKAVDGVNTSLQFIETTTGRAVENAKDFSRATINMTIQVGKSKEAGLAAETVLVLFPGTMPLVGASEVLKTQERRAAAEEFTEKYILEPSVTLSYRETNRPTSLYYHGTTSQVFRGVGMVREYAGVPPEISVTTLSGAGSFVNSVLEGFVPIVGPVLKVERKVLVGDFRGAGAELAIQFLSSAPKLVIKSVVTTTRAITAVVTVGPGLLANAVKLLPKMAIKGFRIYDIGIGLYSNVTGALEVGNNLKNRDDAKLTLFATQIIVSEKFSQLQVPDYISVNEQLKPGERIVRPVHLKARSDLLINEAGQVSIVIPVGEPVEATGPLYPHHSNPVSVRNYYGIEMDIAELYNTTQEIGKQIRELRKNEWNPMGLSYERQILEAREKTGW